METPDDRRLVNMLGAAALGLADQIRQATERVTGQTGAAPAALVMLSQSLRGGSMDDLRRAIGLTNSGAVRLVDRLVSDGLVERRAGSDNRSLALVLTRSGQSTARRVLAARADVVAAALRAISPAERDVMATTMAKVLAAETSQRLEARRAGAPPAGGWLCRLCDQTACGRPEGRCPAAETAAETLRAADGTVTPDG